MCSMASSLKIIIYQSKFSLVPEKFGSMIAIKNIQKKYIQNLLLKASIFSNVLKKSRFVRLDIRFSDFQKNA